MQQFCNKLAVLADEKWNQRLINKFPTRWLVSSSQVEFPEARIYEETLNTLLYETMLLPDNSLLEATRRSYNNCGSLSEEEEGPGGAELRERVRRIHVKRYSTYDDRPLGHWDWHQHSHWPDFSPHYCCLWLFFFPPMLECSLSSFTDFLHLLQSKGAAYRGLNEIMWLFNSVTVRSVHQIGGCRAAALTAAQLWLY